MRDLLTLIKNKPTHYEGMTSISITDAMLLNISKSAIRQMKHKPYETDYTDISKEESNDIETVQDAAV